MKRGKKYATFYDLKSGESKASDSRLALKKHADLAKVMKEIASLKSQGLNQDKKATARKKDLEDIEQLKKIKGEE